MIERRFNPPLWFGLVLSLVAHAFVLLPLLLRMMSTSGEALALNATFNPDDIQPPAAMTEPENPLGIDEGSPSTITWLGYREPEPHQAPPSDVEQAAFTDDPSTPAPMTPMTPFEQPNEVTNESDATSQDLESGVEQSQSEDAQDAEQEDAEQSQEPSDATEPTEAAPVVLETDAPAQDIATSPHISTTRAVFAFAEHLQRLMETAAHAQQQNPASKSAPESAEADAAQQASESATAAAPTTPSKPSAPQSDKDADPSSVVEIPFEEIKLGKPLAAHGLTLRPQKPSFTTLTLMTAAPFNPLAEIQFNRAGNVHNAVIVESSKDARVDRAIEASLFRWKAEGKQLESLTGEHTITIRIRIILNPRRR